MCAVCPLRCNQSAGPERWRLAYASGSRAVGERLLACRLEAGFACRMFPCYGPELLLEPPQLIASTVRYERGIGGRNVTVNAHSSYDSSPGSGASCGLHTR